VKIVVDAQSILEQQAGVGKFTTNLMRALIEVDKKNRYVLCAFGDPLRMKSDEFKIKFTWIPRKVYMGLWKVLGIEIPYNWLSGKADVYFFPNFIKLPTSIGKSIIAIHDLAFIKFPETTEPKNLIFLRKYLKSSVESSDHIVVISESTKKDVIEELGVRNEKITVVPLALPEEIRKNPSTYEISAIKDKFGLDKYILFVGTLEPRKNLPRLIQAFEGLSSKYPELKLVLVGKRAWGVEQLDNAVANSPVKQKIIFPGYLKDTELSAIYSAASVFAFPSLYEGFGMPILEAFSYGVPIVTSNVSSMPEVAGDAALLINPLDVRELIGAIDKLLSDHGFKENLIKKGKLQLRNFSWDKSAREFAKILETMEDIT